MKQQLQMERIDFEAPLEYKNRHEHHNRCHYEAEWLPKEGVSFNGEGAVNSHGQQTLKSWKAFRAHVIDFVSCLHAVCC